MGKPPTKKLPKKRSLGVHVKRYTEPFSRKMLSISINKQDGGVMVTPLLDDWGEIICSRLTVSDSPDGGLFPEEDSYVRVGAENRPKLHYHRSGMASVQPAGFSKGEGRKTIHLPSLDELEGVQIFSVAARLPGKLPWDRRASPGDLYSIMDRPDVRSLLMSGVIYDRERVPDESLGGLEAGNPVTFASGSSNSVLIDLSGYGLEAVLGMHFNPGPADLPDFAADFSLVSFHQEQLASKGAVAIHAGPGAPLAALMHPVPRIENIHRVADLDPIITIHSRELPDQ